MRVGAQTARLLPDADRLLSRRDSADAPVCAAPHGIESPRQILKRVSQVGHLPVENGANYAMLIEQEVAGAIVGVDDAHPLCR